MLPPELTLEQRRAVKVFELTRWFPALSSCMATRNLTNRGQGVNSHAAVRK